MSEVVLEGRGLRHGYGATRVLDDVDIALTAGEIVAVMGPSGSGKSTLLHLLREPRPRDRRDAAAPARPDLRAAVPAAAHRGDPARGRRVPRAHRRLAADGRARRLAAWISDTTPERIAARLQEPAREDAATVEETGR